VAIPRERTQLENYLVYGIDLKNRRIFFGHPIDWGHIGDDAEVGYNDFTEASVEMAVRAIKRMEKDHPKHVIEIHLNSCGGDYKAMLYLYDVIRASTCAFHFYGGGRINSSATWIMAVCDRRYLYENATVMLHNGRSGYNAPTSTSYNDNLIDVEYEKEEAERLNRIYAENSLIPKKVWDEVLVRDLKISAQMAVDAKLAEKIVPLPKRGNLRKERLAHMKNVDKKALNDLIKKLYKRVGVNPSGKEIIINIPTPDEADPNVVIDNSPINTEPEDSDNKGE